MGREWKQMNVCLSSAGRRVALLECFREALSKLGQAGRVVVVDTSRTAPTFHLADAAWRVPPCTAPEFIPLMLDLCKRERISLIVPTIDTELPVYARHRDDFAAIGVAIAVSGPETIAIAADKVVTHAWFTQHGFPTVRQGRPQEVLADPASWAFPLVVKPLGGSAGLGLACARSAEALAALASERDDLVVQEIAPGVEHTINVFVDRSGRCRCALPHERIEVRSGEVSKAVTVKHPALMALAKEIAEALPDSYGAMNIQCFLAEHPDETTAATEAATRGALDSSIRVIELNPRFGGGYPLAYAAGADFPRWLIQEAAGIPCDAGGATAPSAEIFDGWQDGLAMLRYDEAVFVPVQAICPPEGQESRTDPIRETARLEDHGSSRKDIESKASTPRLPRGARPSPAPAAPRGRGIEQLAGATLIMAWIVMMAIASNLLGSEHDLQHALRSVLSYWPAVSLSLPDIGVSSEAVSMGAAWSIDKLRHLVESGVLAVLIFRWLLTLGTPSCSWVVGTALALTCVAGDELHESVWGGVGMASALASDFLGAALALGVASTLRAQQARCASRALDVIGATIGLTIGAPLMLAAAIGVWLNMGSPVLFRQRRLGRGERPFTLYKFRTMLVQTSENGRPLRPSERLTPTGRILRQLSIDELPQLWNVLRGDMSLVGPRPLYVEYLPFYTERERLRHLVRPGLTGLAQVSGRNRLGWDERLELDARYVEAKSFWLDLRILLKTVIKLVRRSDVMDAAVQGNLAKHRAGAL